MKKLLEKMSVLGLSLMLIASYSISPVLPQMKTFYQGFAPDQVELLVSVPSFFVVATLLVSPLISRKLNEHQMIVIGLLTMAVAGVAPVFYQDYTFVLVSRMLFGTGLGLMNSHAIAIISHYYSGRERVQMLGYRGSAEVVGAAFFIILVGQLLRLEWHAVFAVYGFALLILLCYLLFVPKKEMGTVEVEPMSASAPEKLSASDRWVTLVAAVIAGLVICTNTVINMRTAEVVLQAGFGDATQASLVLSAQQLIGIVAGIAFAPMLARLKGRLMGVSLIGLALALLGMTWAGNLVLLAVAEILSGFFYSIIITEVFHDLSEQISLHLLQRATALAVVGCNVGSAMTPYVLKGLSTVGIVHRGAFFFFAVVLSILGLVLLLLYRKPAKKPV